MIEVPCILSFWTMKFVKKFPIPWIHWYFDPYLAWSKPLGRSITGKFHVWAPITLCPRHQEVPRHRQDAHGAQVWPRDDRKE
jgi:hypothetical protein